MPVSNIQSVDLNGGGLTIIGTIEDLDAYEVKLLHVWLAQPGPTGENGAGLAIDCLNGTPPAVLKGEKFTLTAAPAGTGNLGVFGTFVQGPATVSAIAVLVPNPNQPTPKRLVPEVLEWSRILTLPEDPNPVVLTTPR
jgi:hypothetical protein